MVTRFRQISRNGRWLAAALVSIPMMATAGVAVSSGEATAAAPPLLIEVGYADNLRASVLKFPTPFYGSPGVVYEGCTPGPSCSFDSGAVRVVNTSASSVTLNSVVVHISTCTYDIWPHNVTIPGGGSLVVTQTTANFAVCAPGTGTMDSSDIGPGGVDWSYCNQSGVIPTVDVTAGGVTQQFLDSNQVLNTGGIDVAACGAPWAPGTPGAYNESQQWTQIGTGGCATSESLTLTPGSQSLVVGQQASLSNSFVNACGQGVPGATINFAVTAGPDAGVTGSGVTDLNGDATFSYGGIHAGADTVVASLSNITGTAYSNSVAVTWRDVTSTSTTLSGGGQMGAGISVATNTPVTDQAVITGNSASSATGTVTYDVYSDASCSNVVNSGAPQPIAVPGTAPPSQPVSLAIAGHYYWQASYSGDSSNAPSTSTCGLVVNGGEVESARAPTTITTLLGGWGQSGATITVAPSSAVSDQGTLAGADAAVATGTFTYDVYSDTGCTSKVNAGAPLSITSPGVMPASAPVSLSQPGTYYWQATYSGDDLNLPSTSPCGSEIETVAAASVEPPNLSAVIQISTSAIYDGSRVVVSSPELQAACAAVSFETLQGGTPAAPTVGGGSLPVVVDADGNVTVVVDGIGCIPGRYTVLSAIPAFGVNASTVISVNPPQITFPYRFAGYPANEVETGNTTASGHSDVYTVFIISTSPAYAEDTATISAASLANHCKAGTRWESNGTGSPFVNSATATATIDNDGNASFVFKGASCAGGKNKVTLTVATGGKRNPKYSTSYVIVPPAITYSGPQPGMTMNVNPTPLMLIGG